MKINTGDLIANPNYRPEEVLGIVLGPISFDKQLYPSDYLRIRWVRVRPSRVSKAQADWDSSADYETCLMWKKRLDTPADWGLRVGHV